MKVQISYLLQWLQTFEIDCVSKFDLIAYSNRKISFPPKNVEHRQE